MRLRLAAHWTATATVAACTYTVATIPFAGINATAAGLAVAAGVSLIGIATAPHIKGRP